VSKKIDHFEVDQVENESIQACSDVEASLMPNFKYRQIYSAGRDGKIRLWEVNYEKIP